MNWPLTFGALHSVDEMRDCGCSLGGPDVVLIDGVRETDRPMEKAAEALYRNTEAYLGDRADKEQFLTLMLWMLYKEVYSTSLGTAIYLLNRLNEIARTGFEKARLLLLSQCDSNCPGEWIPQRRADWKIIEDAMGILRNEQNGKREEADELLDRLDATGRYEPMFEKWGL
jgi:hypothetical protein